MPRSTSLLRALALAGSVAFVPVPALAQVSAPEPPGGWPAVTVHGETWSQMTLLQRNLGGPADQSTAFPPHRVVGNIYYVGTNSLATYLIGTRDRLNYVGANQDLGAARSRRNAGQETSTKFW